ncbi:histone-lysine N-methyltransferase SETDB1-B-like [Morone saxatilis]|uniref:histone-lysine N-methyltransferase SETDB1-B-like n=1 Tax=Morone saxatilis TaxID=34816 RepID=UPI0015E2562F|nr:histone-lysine N-methyltransferase SETDB1-B-like [Morone saxatilis]
MDTVEVQSVHFVDEGGRALCPGHHIAFDNTAKLEQLYVGARVVVKCQDETFRPAILAELPSRKNRLRFLVFLDDHIPVYIGLPFLHLVCRPFMEGDEIEMTKEELQKWIRAKVKENDLFSTHVQEKYDLLQSLLERRQSQAAHLQNLYKSVAACEVIVKKQYSLLGWEYKDTVSDDDDGITPPSPRQVPGSPTRNAPLLLEDSEKVYKVNGKKVSISLKRQPAVVLTRLSPREIRSYRPTPQDHDREDESLNNLSSDSRWEPDNDSSDLNYSTSSYNTGSNKRRKVDQKDKKTAKRHATPQARTNAGATSNAGKTSTPPADTNEETPVSTVPTLPQSSHKAAKTQDPPSVQEEKIIVNMNVLARKRDATWQQGKIVEIVTKEGGRLKYKVSLEKGKILVSGHHIAFVCMPKVEQLFVGARVVVKCNSKEPQFFPGIVAELPNRINHMRFLVFLDNKTPVYVGLPLLHLVCKPMTDPLDDIKNEAHKNFLKEYIKNWPYPPQTKYKLRQIINAELGGVQQKCEVQVVDCSLIQVVFQVNQQKEWIYRGSSRLEHMINMRKQLESKKDGMKNKSTAANVSSKMAH